MILQKTIRLLPSAWSLDVFVCPVKEHPRLGIIMSHRYGLHPQYYSDNMCQGNYVDHFESTEDSEMKGEIRIIMQLTSLKPSILVHELNHVQWRLSHLSKAELNFDSQEWGSMLLEYLFEECSDAKTYTKIS